MPEIFPKKGSILVFSLVILSFMLVSALSIASVSVSERKSASTTERSNRSFQVADTGVERVLQKIYKGNFADPAAIASSLGGSCSGGAISAATPSGSYEVTLFDNNGNAISCSDAGWRDDAVKLRSQGFSGNTTRAVEVAVAATADLQKLILTGCYGPGCGSGADAEANCPSGSTAIVGSGHCNIAAGSNQCYAICIKN